MNNKFAKIKSESVVGEDFSYREFPRENENPNTIFSVHNFNENRKILRAIGYGDTTGKNTYGNGALFVYEKDLIYVEDEETISKWFELSYSSYMVLHRLILEAMPVKWQQRFVKMLKEIGKEFDISDVPYSFLVKARDINSKKFISDPYSNYRHGTLPSRKNKNKDKK